MFNFVLGGIETTAALISNFLFMLAKPRYQHMQARVIAEVDALDGELSGTLEELGK